MSPHLTRMRYFSCESGSNTVRVDHRPSGFCLLLLGTMVSKLSFWKSPLMALKRYGDRTAGLMEAFTSNSGEFFSCDKGYHASTEPSGIRKRWLKRMEILPRGLSGHIFLVHVSSRTKPAVDMSKCNIRYSPGHRKSSTFSTVGVISLKLPQFCIPRSVT